jgi:hypothetical protein
MTDAFSAKNLPVDPSAFADLFYNKPTMLTDEVQSALIKSYGEEVRLHALLTADNDADAVEGSLKDNTDEIVTILREFARDRKEDFPLCVKANRRQLRHAFGVVRRRMLTAAKEKVIGSTAPSDQQLQAAE